VFSVSSSIPHFPLYGDIRKTGLESVQLAELFCPG
jgi:hypothetical protein